MLSAFYRNRLYTHSLTPTFRGPFFHSETLMHTGTPTSPFLGRLATFLSNKLTRIRCLSSIASCPLLFKRLTRFTIRGYLTKLTYPIAFIPLSSMGQWDTRIWIWSDRIAFTTRVTVLRRSRVKLIPFAACHVNRWGDTVFYEFTSSVSWGCVRRESFCLRLGVLMYSTPCCNVHQRGGGGFTGSLCKKTPAARPWVF